MISVRARAALAVGTLTWLASSGALGFDFRMDEWDLVGRSGIAVGVVVVEDPTQGTTKTYPVGGIPAGLALYRDISASWSFLAEGNLMFDVVNQQTLRQGADLGLVYHLVGGPRHLVDSYRNAVVTARSPYALSFVIREGMATYAAASPTSSERFSGSVLETRVGFDGRVELTASDAVRVGLMSNLISLPSSTSRLSAQMIEIWVGWQRTLDFFDP